MMIVSVTSLSSYLYCPRKLFLTNVLGLAEIPKEALVKGSIRHDTYDKINKQEEEFVKGITKKLSLDALSKKYEKAYTSFLKESVSAYKEELKKLNLDPKEILDKTKPYFVRESKMRSLNLFQFIEKENILGEELWKRLTPKINSEVRITSKFLQLKGIIDQIEVWDNRMVPVELKTGKMPQEGVWPGHRIQLGCYALLMEERYNSRIKYGYVHYLDHEEKRIIQINPFLREEVNGLIKMVQMLMTSKTPPDFCGNDNKCSSCGLRESCYNQAFIKEKIGEITPN